MSHENPSSLVAGSTHLTRGGEKVFIQAVLLKAPWGSNFFQPVRGCSEGAKDCHYYDSNGRFYSSSESGHDLVSEYKEPVVHEAYVVVWSDGTRDSRCTLALAKASGLTYSNKGRLSWKIIKVTGNEEASVDFNPLAHEQTK